MKAIIKYRKHPNVVAIASEFTKECFSLNRITIEHAVKEIITLDSSKAMQATSIPGKVMKGNNIFLQNKYALISMNLLAKENFQTV